jgi:hypothetical protein
METVYENIIHEPRGNSTPPRHGVPWLYQIMTNASPGDAARCGACRTLHPLDDLAQLWPWPVQATAIVPLYPTCIQSDAAARRASVRLLNGSLETVWLEAWGGGVHAVRPLGGRGRAA